MNEIVLSKSSSTQEIKAYFNAVLELSKTDNEFPINLDEVWMLVYPRKDHAVRALEENFIKDVDYVVFPKNGETLMEVDQQTNTAYPFPAWSTSSLARCAQCLKFTVKYSTKRFNLSKCRRRSPKR